MICPDTVFDCDNPGCRRGGCQGRRPDLPLLRAPGVTPPMPRPEPAGSLLAAETATFRAP